MKNKYIPKSVAAACLTFFMLAVSARAQKPVLEKELNGVKVSVFKVDEKGNVTPNHIWIGAMNANKEAMTVTAVITYTHKGQYEGKEAQLLKQSKIAHVVAAGKGEVIWERDGDAIEVTKIESFEVK
jgi:hypothetical protein